METKPQIQVRDAEAPEIDWLAKLWHDGWQDAHSQIVPEDRWAVVLYVRALQRAQTGTAADVTDEAAKHTLGLK